MSVMYERLKKLNKPFIVVRYQNLRFEGVVISIDEKFLELYDYKRCYRKFLRLSEIQDLEVESGEH